MRTLSANEVTAVAGGHWEDGMDVVYFVDGPEGWYGVDTSNGGGEHATSLSGVTVTAPVSNEATGGIIGGAIGGLVCWELGPGSLICGAAGAYAGSWIANNPQTVNRASDGVWAEMSRQTRSTPFTK